MRTQVRSENAPAPVVTGVTWCDTRKTWLARDGQTFLGRFASFEDAATKVILTKCVKSS